MGLMEVSFSVCRPLWIIAWSPSALIKYLTLVCPKPQVSWVVRELFFETGTGRGEEVKDEKTQWERMKRKPVKTSGGCFRGYVLVKISRESCTACAASRSSFPLMHHCCSPLCYGLANVELLLSWYILKYIFTKK